MWAGAFTWAPFLRTTRVTCSEEGCFANRSGCPTLPMGLNMLIILGGLLDNCSIATLCPPVTRVNKAYGVKDNLNTTFPAFPVCASVRRRQNCPVIPDYPPLAGANEVH